MNRRGLELFTGLAALAMAAMTIATMSTWGNPQLTDLIDNITDYYVQQRGQVLSYAFFALLWGVSLLAFGAGIRSLVYRAEEEPHTLSNLAFGTTVIASIWFMVLASTNGGLAMIANRAS